LTSQKITRSSSISQILRFLDGKMAIVFGTPRKIRKPQTLRKRLPIQIYPRLIERKYEKLLVSLFDELRDIMEQDLFPQLEPMAREFSQEFGIKMRQDDFLSSLTRIMAGILVKFAGRITQKEAEMLKVATNVDAWNKQQSRKVVKHVLGVDLLEMDKSMSAAVNLWVKQNVALCVNLADGEAAIIEKMVTDAFRNGFSWQELRQGLQDHWVGRDQRKTNWVPGFSVPYRARLVARDQIGKLNGQISKMRQTNVGIWRYKWRTSLDERVRDSHRKLEGKIFAWNPEDGEQPPPEIGHPGNDYQCRCYAEPIITDLLDFDEDE
jgi:SPP1 gp7 family putative phage head morphogenesis protein